MRPSPRLLIGGFRLLRRAVTALNNRPVDGDPARTAWTLNLLTPLLRILDPRGTSPGRE
ncbi:hypothetical protein [Streptomyces sp. NBC_00203]|uniref:hypothetical protein n=1 Tax=Streptomyces sp. NBC_00203 TaxID=2975680 RepID=UPI003252604D